MTEVKNNKAFDFLLYSYFGIKESDLNDQSKKIIHIFVPNVPKGHI